MILTLILGILDKSLDIYRLYYQSMTPAQRIEWTQRILDQTEWMYKLLNKFSDDIEKLIPDPPKPPVTPPKP